jgi:ATP-binding cassette subfamily F protein 3
LFSKDEVQKPLDGLSGGELRRLSLAVLVHSDANMLVLDEPTNHLDLESREALEDALMSFPGSLLLVSHDRALLDAVGSRTFAIEDGTLHAYEGGWAEYVQAREERKEAERAPAPAPKAKAARPARGNGKPGLSKNAQRAQKQLEGEIEAAEAALTALEEELADPGAWADPERSAESSERHARAKRDVEELYARLEGVSG